jgi:hypothetical protein
MLDKQYPFEVLTFFEELLFFPVEGESYKMGGDESMCAVHQEYSDRRRRESESPPSLPRQGREAGGVVAKNLWSLWR